MGKRGMTEKTKALKDVLKEVKDSRSSIHFVRQNLVTTNEVVREEEHEVNSGELPKKWSSNLNQPKVAPRPKVTPPPSS